MAGVSKNVGFVLTWKIKNYSLCHQRDNECLKSPLFRIEMLDNSEWELWLYPIKNNAVVFELYRALSVYAPGKISFDLELRLLKKNCPPLCSRPINITFNRNNTLGELLSVPIDTILNEKEHFIPEDTMVVQCRFWNETFKNRVKCFAVTQISMQKYHISLPVCRISDSLLLSSEILLYSVSKKYPNFKITCTKKQDIVDFKVHTIAPSSRLFVRSEISIQQLNCSRNVLFDGYHWFEAGTANKVWTLSNIFESVIQGMKNFRCKDYELDINLFASDGSQNSYIESISYCSKMPESREIIQASPEYLLAKVEKIYLEEIFCDFTINCEGKSFKIHKAMFGLVSPVFTAMFESNMVEKKDSTVTIEDMDSDTLEKLISYVYTGETVDLEWHDAVKLFAAADKYGMMHLKQLCARILTSKMDTENVTGALFLADLHRDDMVMRAAKQLVRENAEQVFRSEMWKTFMGENPTIACEVMHENYIHHHTESP